MDGLDTSSLAPYAQAAQSASSNAQSLATSAPQMLQQLKANLTQIFTKDNPVMQARDNALQTYLNTPSQARADLLGSNLPNVEGSALTLSPTQQNAIVTARQNAALVPLAGLNQVVTQQYGNIPQLVQNAGNIYQGQIQSAQIASQSAQQQYQNAFEVLKTKYDAAQNNKEFNEKVREFDVQAKNDAANRAIAVGQQQDRAFYAALQDGVARLQRGENWGTVWSSVKSLFPDKSSSEIDLGLGTEWRKPGAFEQYTNKQNLTKATGGKTLAMQRLGANVVNDLDSVSSSIKNQTGTGTAVSTLGKLNGNILGIPTTIFIRSKDEQDLANLESKYFALVQSALTAVQGSRPSDYDVKSYQQKLGPSIANTPEVNAKRIQNLMSLAGIQGYNPASSWEVVSP